MSKNIKKPQIPSYNGQYQHNGQYQIEQQGAEATSVSPSNGAQQFRVPATPFPNGQSQVEQNGIYPPPRAYPSNGTQQFQVPMTPFTNGHYQIEEDSTNVLPIYPSNGIQQFQVPATPYPWAAPAIVDPRKHERVERYAQWLSANNSLPASPQKLQAYQDASLEIKKIGKREVRTFAPFQERTSALQVITSDQLAIFSMLAVYWIVGLVLLHLVMFTITFGIITLLYICGFVVSGILATKSFNGSSGEKIDEEIIVALDQLGVEWPTYTILCPLYKESAIVPQFVEAMKALDYPTEKLQVLFLTEENDSETRAALYRMQLPPGFTILTVPQGSPQTKPRACNFGLLQAKGQFVVIFDAEDKPEPYQLKKAVLTFANHGPEVACVQAKLNYYNSKQNLLTRWFTAEYSTWFDIMLPGLQGAGFSLPLGGTSNHFRTEVLRALGGWDAFNVTEDCDLGLRISQYGLKTAVLDSTTYEEATSRVKSWLFQRSRWIKGYLQTYLVHMRHPVQTLRQGHVRKFFSLQLIVGAWTVVLLINPFMWALTIFYILFHPVQLYSLLFPGPILYAGAFCLIFGNFFYVYIHLIGCVRRKEYALIKWVLLLPLYWVMMSVSAYIAFYQLIVKPHYWEKTQHGSHLAPAIRAQAGTRLSSDVEPEGRAVAVSMPTTRLFATTVGRVFKHTTTSNELGTTTQRVKAVRSTLLTRLGQRKVRRQMHRPRTRDLWLIATIIIACIMSIGAWWYYFQLHEITFYSDSLSHMRIARSVFDSATPGLAQLGTVWLPLPHVLMWPFIWNDFLWRTGLAGSFVSMPCYVITSAYIFLSARRLTKSGFAAFISALAFSLNPNVLYLQSTPLSEIVCTATFAMSAYYFLCWIQDERFKYLILTAASVFLSTLARYDGWALFAALLLLVPLISLLKRRTISRLIGESILFLALGGLGIGLWLLWNEMIFGDPLYFKDNIYSAQSQQMQLLHAGHLYSYHNLWQSFLYYAIDAGQSGGTILCLLAIMGLLWFIWRYRRSAEAFAVLIFLVPFAFYVVSLYTGQAAIWITGANPPGTPSQFFNVRYGAQIIVPMAVLIVLPFRHLPAFSWKRVWNLIRCLLLLVIIVQYWLLSYQGIVELKETADTSSCNSPPSASLYVAQHYNGGYILEFLHTSGADPIRMNVDFKDIIWEGSNTLWMQALQDPQDTVTWIFINPTNSNDLVAQSINVYDPSFLENFSLVARQSDGIELYHRSNQPLTPIHIVPPPCT